MEYTRPSATLYVILSVGIFAGWLVAPGNAGERRR
jgi:hypothetical protein